MKFLLALFYFVNQVLSKPVDESNAGGYITASSGERLILPCSIGKSGSCQWTKDGFGLGIQHDLAGWPRYSLEGECDLVMDPVLPIDEGSYNCQEGGKSRKNVAVTVVAEPGPPNIQQAKDGDLLEVVEDEEVTLDCESKGGRPAADIDWSYGNIKVMEMRKKVMRMEDLHTDLGPQSDQEKKTFKTISTLKFSTKKDTTISCSAFSEDFTTPRTSRPFQVIVKYRPKVEMKFSPEKLKEGDDLKIECSVKAYPAHVTYKWFIDDVEEGFTGNTFEMKKLTRMHHKSNVKCLVENQVGKSEVIKSLDIEFGPKMIIKPATVNAKLGDIVTLTCKAVANPEPTYVWVKGMASSSPEVVGAGEHLSIVASEEAESDYVCNVVSLGFPTISTPPAHIVIDNPLLPITPETKTLKNSFTKVINSFKKDYLLFQKRTEKYMKETDQHFVNSNTFEKKYNIFKKNIKKYPRNYKRFLKSADIL